MPNSAPDSLTPKNLNLVRLPEQTDEEGAEAVVDAVVGTVEGATVAVLGRHCE